MTNETVLQRGVGNVVLVVLKNNSEVSSATLPCRNYIKKKKLQKKICMLVLFVTVGLECIHPGGPWCPAAE